MSYKSFDLFWKNKSVGGREFFPPFFSNHQMKDIELVKSSLDGNKKSLEELIGQIQSLIFNLALRFLWNRADAEDATQEILIKVVTNLSKFDGRSKFSTWTYRVAVNHLLNLKRTTLEKTFVSFDAFAEDLSNFKVHSAYGLPDQGLMEKEIKVGCTLAMLQCLDRDLRMAFILGTVFRLKSKTASQIVGTTPDNFSKRIELSRKLIGSFLNSYCGVYNPYNHCRCNKRINFALESGRISKAKLNFADKIQNYTEEMEELHSLSNIYQNHGSFESDSNFAERLKKLIESKKVMIDD
jgi:RNA polymerase sigma factor (sigma-70 family)